MSRPAVFLDRDGTLVHDPGYLRDPAGVKILPGVSRAVEQLAEAGFARVIITNQSGIGRGILDVAAFDRVQAELVAQLTRADASIDGCFHCPHLPTDGCVCRKPGTALHREAAARLDLDIARSWCVGDRMSDVNAAAELGCRAALVMTGEGADHASAARSAGIPVVDDLAAAVVLILAHR